MYDNTIKHSDVGRALEGCQLTINTVGWWKNLSKCRFNNQEENQKQVSSFFHFELFCVVFNYNTLFSIAFSFFCLLVIGLYFGHFHFSVNLSLKFFLLKVVHFSKWSFKVDWVNFCYLEGHIYFNIFIMWINIKLF